MRLIGVLLSLLAATSPAFSVLAPTKTACDVLRSQLRGRETASCALGATQVSVRFLDIVSPLQVPHGKKVPCLTLTNIHVERAARRKGHARQAMHALRTVAAGSGRALVVQNVVSQKMHALVRDLGGQPLFGCRAGAKGCTYWLPDESRRTWKEMTVER
mmetsp:Transcript_15555/g.49904  ORF Transcript_15555/g.49904 Transcript_15555/m.49904 type:complete len:159 (+) Transcript_15555:35-511(+)